MNIYRYKFEGIDSFYDNRDKVVDAICSIVPNANDKFIDAFDEAVCNVFKYALVDSHEMVVNIEFHVDEVSAFIIVGGATRKFNIFDYRNYLYTSSESYRKNGKTWQELTENNLHGRGIWMMLYGCDFVIFDADNMTVMLHISRSNKPHSVSNKVYQLLHRMFIKKNGVVM